MFMHTFFCIPSVGVLAVTLSSPAVLGEKVNMKGTPLSKRCGGVARSTHTIRRSPELSWRYIVPLGRRTTEAPIITQWEENTDFIIFLWGVRKRDWVKVFKIWEEACIVNQPAHITYNFANYAYHLCPLLR